MASLYDIGFPTLSGILKTELAILKKAEAWAAEKGIKTSELTEARIYEDMHPLHFQVLIILNTTRSAITQITGRELPPLEKPELTMDESFALLEETIKIFEEVQPEKITVKENDTVTLSTKVKQFPMPAIAFVQEYALPNAFFHLNMTYAILRMKGVPVGKMDYLKNFWRRVDFGDQSSGKSS
ncbi:hypothetical protein F4810DRAFT_684249 [Camillea tinctor]|nr:hypothetical protein F4810DRAFT_684249 [Camillea tinctor]